MPQPVTEVHTGLQGCPKKIINIDFLKEAVSNSWQITCTELACVLGIHRNTLWLYMKNHSVEWKYTHISNGDLDNLITEFKARRPESGIQYIIGFLRKCGIHVQYHRVTQSVHRINCLGQVLQDRRVKTRCKYQVKWPNTLWHIDGHHKLIRWGIVIHRFIDRFCWTVCMPLNQITPADKWFCRLLQSELVTTIIRQPSSIYSSKRRQNTVYHPVHEAIVAVRILTLQCIWSWRRASAGAHSYGAHKFTFNYFYRCCD